MSMLGSLETTQEVQHLSAVDVSRVAQTDRGSDETKALT